MLAKLMVARVGYGGARAGGQVVCVLGVLAILGLSLVLAPAALASTNLTWSGEANVGVPKWSEGENWESKTAPTSGETIGALSFPALAGKDLSCTFATPSGGCGYGSENNVSGLSAESMSIDDGEDYSIIGEPITLDSGGLSASPAAVTNKLTISELDLPVVLGAAQTWDIGGEGAVGLLGGDLNSSDQHPVRRRGERTGQKIIDETSDPRATAHENAEAVQEGEA